jgi:hypothetical protein
VFELERADIGFGKLILDDKAVTRTGLFGRTTVAWDDVLEYRLTVDYVTKDPNGIRVRVPFVNMITGATDPMFRLCGIELRSKRARLAFNWRFRDIDQAIGYAVSNVEPRLTRIALESIRDRGVVACADFELSRQSVLHQKQATGAENVDAFEIFATAPLELRVVRKDTTFIWHKLQNVPNPHTLLAVAEALGYVVRGRELLPQAKLPEARLL